MRIPRAVPRHSSSRLHARRRNPALPPAPVRRRAGLRRGHPPDLCRRLRHTRRAWTFHEAADVDAFKPLEAQKDIDVLWIGNWGDEERSQRTGGIPDLAGGGAAAAPRGRAWSSLSGPRRWQKLAQAGIEFRGYLPNLCAPKPTAKAACALHVPRRQYAQRPERHPDHPGFRGAGLRHAAAVFALDGRGGACSARARTTWWCRTATQCERKSSVCCATKPHAGRSAANGLDTIRSRHTCAHRAEQLLEICEELGR